MENVYDLQIDRIREKLAQTPDAWLYPPASTDQAEKAERDHSIHLPVAYRRFLLEVGDGGWLWGWPLYPLAKAVSITGGSLAASFPFTGNWRIDEQVEATLISENRDYDLNGALPIFHFGCTHSDILVTSGTHAGTVMYDGLGTDQGLYPLHYRSRALYAAYRNRRTVQAAGLLRLV
jgi:hypothetical protein